MNAYYMHDYLPIIYSLNARCMRRRHPMRRPVSNMSHSKPAPTRRQKNCKRHPSCFRHSLLVSLLRKDVKMAIWSSCKVSPIPILHLSGSILSGHIAAKNAAMEASTTEEQAKLKIAHLKQELSEKEPQAVMAEKENHGLLGQVDEKRKMVSQLEVNTKFRINIGCFIHM